MESKNKFFVPSSEKTRPVFYVEGHRVQGTRGEFVVWYESNNFHSPRRTDSGTIITHTLFKKGVLCIPDDKLKRGFELIAYDYLKVGKQRVLYPLSITIIPLEGSDLNSTVFYAFWEFDFEKDDEKEQSFQMKIGKIIQEALRKCTDREILLYMSCKVHLDQPNEFYPNLHFHTKQKINVEDYCRVTAEILHHLEKNLPRLPKQRPWYKIIDSQVVAKGKINCRSNFAVKAIDCMACKRETLSKDYGTPCDNHPYCFRGIFEVPIVYVVTAVLNCDGTQNLPELSRIKNNMVEELKITHIRPPEFSTRDPFFQVPKDFPYLIVFRKAPIQNDESGEISLHPSDEKWVQNSGLPNVRDKNSTDIPSSHPAFQAIAQELRTQTVNLHWQDVTVKKVKLKVQPKTGLRKYTVFVSGKGCNFCDNHSLQPLTGYKCHKSSNRIYFEIDYRGWLQRCFGGQKGNIENREYNPRKGKVEPCEEFTSAIYNLSFAAKETLFAPAEKKDYVPLLQSTETKKEIQEVFSSAKRAEMMQTLEGRKKLLEFYNKQPKRSLVTEFDNEQNKKFRKMQNKEKEEIFIKLHEAMSRKS